MLTGGTPNIVQTDGTQNILSAGGIEDNNSNCFPAYHPYYCLYRTLYFEFSVVNEWLKLMKLMEYQKHTKPAQRITYLKNRIWLKIADMIEDSSTIYKQNIEENVLKRKCI
ncbi:uncharacterized protein LOC120354330 [Nilaparvata lugens]|uniref:uncharacterized protein LOC111052830 n=1 Tax=Nilaparvata lugens TaxID=108931 RepID=UPI00193E786B|nr:uncharacterized protein LOC111052830 [Nilaparvata lugens]XP_039297236.1 uncharacterized protein LOC120354330 [Nilaparvata lugens]